MAVPRRKEDSGALRLLALSWRPDADALGDEPIWHDGKVVGW